MKLTKKQKKSRKIVFPKLVTSIYFQKGLNPQIVENKEIHRNLYRNRRVKWMWVLRFYMWHLSLTTKLSELIRCYMVILKNGDFLKTKKKVDLGPFGNKHFICTVFIKVLFFTEDSLDSLNTEVKTEEMHHGRTKVSSPDCDVNYFMIACRKSWLLWLANICKIFMYTFFFTPV